MAQRSKYLMIASMDVDPSREELFNDVYNNEHCPLLSQVPGVISVARFETEKLTMIIGGQPQTLVIENQPKHHALYENRGPVGLDHRGVGRRRGPGPLAGAGAPPHPKPPVPLVASNLPIRLRNYLQRPLVWVDRRSHPSVLRPSKGFLCWPDQRRRTLTLTCYGRPSARSRSIRSAQGLSRP